jgi:TonB family protein
MLTRMLSLLQRTPALSASVAIHASLLAGGYASGSPERAPAEVPVWLDLLPVAKPQSTPPLAVDSVVVAPKVIVHELHRRGAARALSRSVASPALAPSVVDPGSAGPQTTERSALTAHVGGGAAALPRFTLPSSKDLVARAPLLVAADKARAGIAADGGARVAAGGSAAWSEADVDMLARLLSSPALNYPAQAREAEIETAVPLELIVDEHGHVVSARALSAVGYGLDAAALRAVRDYRFSPALRAGMPVRVRMRWNVVFRLN